MFLYLELQGWYHEESVSVIPRPWSLLWEQKHRENPFCLVFYVRVHIVSTFLHRLKLSQFLKLSWKISQGTSTQTKNNAFYFFLSSHFKAVLTTQQDRKIRCWFGHLPNSATWEQAEPQRLYSVPSVRKRGPWDSREEPWLNFTRSKWREWRVGPSTAKIPPQSCVSVRILARNENTLGCNSGSCVYKQSCLSFLFIASQTLFPKFSVLEQQACAVFLWISPVMLLKQLHWLMGQLGGLPGPRIGCVSLHQVFQLRLLDSLVFTGFN